MSNQVFRYTKLKRESTFKEPIMPGMPLDMVDLTLYTKSSQVTPVHTEIEYMSGYQRGSHIVKPGFYSSEIASEFAADFNILAFMLNMAMSGYVHGIDGGPLPGQDSHEFYTTKSFRLNSFIMATGQDDHEARTSGCGVNGLTISVSNGELSLSLDGIGSTYNKTEIDNSINANSFDNLDFITFADIEVLLDGQSISCPETKEFTINITNNMSAEDGQRIGSRERCINIAGDLEVTVDFTMFRNTTQFLESYLGGIDTFGQNGASSHKLEFRINTPFGDSLDIVLPDTRITSYSYPTSGNDIVDESLSFKANLGNQILESGGNVETLIYAKLFKTLNFQLG